MGSSGTIPASLEAQALQALLNVLNSSTSPDVLQAQAIMLRRLALEGDVAGSRVPAPLNITEVGGYINLLTYLGQTDMRTQMLAGALGVAGTISGVNWAGGSAGVGWVTIPNDRPSGPAQGTIPLSFQTRSDFAPALRLALQGLHDQGCALPIVAPIQTLPTTAAAMPTDFLPLLGRSFFLVPGTALQNPDTDPLAVAQLTGGPWQIVARCLSAGPIGVTPAQWIGLQCNTTTCTPVSPPAAGRQYVPLAPVLASAGFTPAVAGYLPTSLTDIGWARFNNVTGLVAGMTTLGSELSLLWSPTEIAASALSGLTGYLWNGSAFTASGR
ncbi:MAG TPA: hypothetical protein VE377_00715 [Candidatus Dormibacteraeota bacterium]|nr:hypothetical protein [Candidatus Dormibacteraeota bacterium]